MLLKYFLILCLTLSSLYSYSQLAPNFRVHPSPLFNQIEPSIVRHPSNQMIMFVSAFTIKTGTSFRSEGVYFTTNGGVSWFGNDTCTGTPIQNHGGDPGPIIDKNGRFILTHQGGLQTGMFSNYSDNFGSSWSANYTILIGDQDKGTPGTDDVPSSAFYGRTYLVWTRFSGTIPIVLSYTSNGGDNWSSFIQVNSGQSGHQSLGGNIIVGPSGQVYVTWASALTSSPFSEDCVGFGVSTNGGINWSVQECAYDCNGIKSSSLSPWNIRVNGYPAIDVDKTGGSRNGWIYIAAAEKNLSPAGSDPDVVFHRSTNGGLNWSAGIRVNQDPINNGKVQLFPAIRVDEGGGINVLYYDNRNISSDSMEVYISRSIDGGNTWNDYLVSDHRFRPRSVIGAGTGNMGDNIGITSGNGKLWPVWMDNRTDTLQTWTSGIDISSIGIKKISSEIPAKFELKQNYPNPFNAITNFELRIANYGFVRLILYDALGREAATLINEGLKPGSYEVDFDGTNYTSGVYYYQLIVSSERLTETYRETRKMVLMK
ncbi:MAG: sialidase family protein [Ignavibacteria bacterium]